MGQYPHIRVHGGPRDRGRQYGSQARNQITRSLEAYADVFHDYADWDWPRVTHEAAGFEGAIADFDDRYLEEMRGIADGAGVGFEDVLALNVRTEVMLSATARAASAQSRSVAECSSFALLPRATLDGHTLTGQNWDWLPHSFDTVVILEVEQPEAPNFVTVVQGGLLAKAGMNSTGLGLATNALVTSDDDGRPGLPYHVVLRAILDAQTITDALAAIQCRPRSSSANYLITHRDGIALNIEAAPGDFARLFLTYPEDGRILHTNHFLSSRFDGVDVSLWVMPDSPLRLERLHDLVAAMGAADVEALTQILADHAGHPYGVCCHPDSRYAPTDQGATVASLIMDLDQATMWVADGNPCTASFRSVDYDQLLGLDRPVAAL